jgi:hypothetical protein
MPLAALQPRQRRTAVAVVSLGLLASVAATASPAAADTLTFTQVGLSATVTGTSVVAEATVKASSSAQAEFYGVCVRSSSGANLDFPKVSATISTTGTPFTSKPEVFPNGTYSYFPCVYANGGWTDVGATETFTVGEAPHRKREMPHRWPPATARSP